MSEEVDISHSIFFEIKEMIEQSHQQVAVAVNATMTMLYWQVGKRINEEVLQDKRAEYGKQVVATLARQLEAEDGSGRRNCLRTA